jgi:hypothetical protein
MESGVGCSAKPFLPPIKTSLIFDHPPSHIYVLILSKKWLTYISHSISKPLWISDLSEVCSPRQWGCEVYLKSGYDPLILSQWPSGCLRPRSHLQIPAPHQNISKNPAFSITIFSTTGGLCKLRCEWGQIHICHLNFPNFQTDQRPLDQRSLTTKSTWSLTTDPLFLP